MKFPRISSLSLLIVGLIFAGFAAFGIYSVSAQAESVSSNNDCTGGGCGAEIDSCGVSGTQCYTPQYCTEYNTPRFSSPLRLTATAGQSFSYEVKVAQVNPNPSRDLAPWEHPLIQERRLFEAGWFGANVTSANQAGLSGSGLVANPSSVVVQKRPGVPQVPDSTGLIISGVPTTPGRYLVTLNTRNDLQEWIFEAGGSDNQSTTFAGISDDREYVRGSASCSRADILEIEVVPPPCDAQGTPVITSPDVVNAQVGTPMSFQATGNNYTSLSMSAERLPGGTNWSGPLSFTGTPTISGTYTLSINAENAAPGCSSSAASKNVTVIVAPEPIAPVCATSTPTITSSGSAPATIGANFPGYTIQTSQSAENYSIVPSGGDTSFPRSLEVVGNRSLEGMLASTQPKQNYRFQARAWNTLPSGQICASEKEVAIALSCPSASPYWNSESGQCSSGPVCNSSSSNWNPATERCETVNLVCNSSSSNWNPATQRCETLVCNSSSSNWNPATQSCGSVCVGAACGGGRVVCADPRATNFGLPGSCQPRTSCGAGETGTPPNCSQISCPNCGVTKMCDVCVATNEETGACNRREMQPAQEVPSVTTNTCGMKRSLYYCPDETPQTPPPPPGEQACALPVTVTTPDRQIIQKGDQCTISWEVNVAPSALSRQVSPVPSAQQQYLRCVIFGPNLSQRVGIPSGSIFTPKVEVQSLYKFVCRNGDAKVSNTATFTCRVSPRFEER